MLYISSQSFQRNLQLRIWPQNDKVMTKTSFTGSDQNNRFDPLLYPPPVTYWSSILNRGWEVMGSNPRISPFRAHSYYKWHEIKF